MISSNTTGSYMANALALAPDLPLFFFGLYV
jgi:hypothetical protein